MLRSLMTASASSAVLALSLTAFAQQPSKYGSAEEAKNILTKAIAAVKADKTKALDMFNKGEGGFVDRVGTLKVLLAGDGAAVLGRDLGRRKAYTAAIRRVPTTELAKAIAAPGAFNPTLYDTQLVTAGGGVPIKAGNEVIGGIGVSGAPGGEKDEACANAGLAKIGDRLN